MRPGEAVAVDLFAVPLDADGCFIPVPAFFAAVPVFLFAVFVTGMVSKI